MKTVYIVGMGMNAQNITREGLDAIDSAKVLFGAPRLLEMYESSNKLSFPVYKPDMILSRINESGESVFAILVSGDVGFFSAAAPLCEALPDFDVRLIPGISCVGAFAAKLKTPWQDFELVSMHGEKVNIVEKVRRNRRVLCLTGGNASEIGQRLCERGLGGVAVYAGERLGYDDEKITETTARGLSGMKLDSLTVLLIQNDGFDSCISFGISDDKFSRLENVPMTKSEVRAVVMSRLGLRPGDICFDVGAGTGSVTVEMSLSAYDGHVYAIEKSVKAIPLIEDNLTRLNIGNATTVCGKAPGGLSRLPAPDAVFIGGSSGEIEGIIEAALKKNPRVRIVAAAIAIESVSAIFSAFNKSFGNVELVQIAASRARPAGDLHLMIAQNPVTIISGGGI